LIIYFVLSIRNNKFTFCQYANAKKANQFYNQNLKNLAPKSLDFTQILDSQSILKELDDLINVIGRAINKFITIPRDGYSYAAEWCKQENCWNEVKTLSINIEIPNRLLVNV